MTLQLQDVAANKCNISTYALGQLNKVRYGVGCNLSHDVFYENYLKYIDCPTVDHLVCFPDECNASSVPTVVFTCSLAITTLNYEYNEDNGQLRFFVNPSDITGKLEPISYNWLYDSDIFDVVGLTNQSQLILTLKPGKQLDTINTSITLAIVDANNCEAVKTCGFGNGELVCTGGTYTICSNTINLVVTNKVTQCSGVQFLTVTKKP